MKNYSTNLILVTLFFLVANAVDNFWVHMAVVLGLAATAGLVTLIARSGTK